MKRLLAVVTTALVVVISALLPAVPARAQSASNSPNVTHVANLQYRPSVKNQLGSDLELVTIAGRDYALAGTLNRGMQVIDVTDPKRPNRVAVYECNLGQGDVQVFRHGARTLFTYTADNGYGIGGRCYADAQAAPNYGTFIGDISDPRHPRTVSFIPIRRGSHNMTVHPSGKWLFNSDSDLPGAGSIEVWDIRNPSRPLIAKTVDIGPSATSSHDITFNEDGSRAYVAALTFSVILDTSYPGLPEIVSRIYDPAINLHHNSDPVTLSTPAGPRTYLLIGDELGGGSLNPYCPGGGVHVYDITGPLELAPVKVGAFFIPEVRTDPTDMSCTAHVIKIHPREKVLTMGWYAAGTRVLDLSGLTGPVGVASGTEATGPVGVGIREVGFFRFPNSRTWAAKAQRIAKDGTFYVYANDYNRGFDVFRYTPSKGVLGSPPTDPGQWLTPQQALERAQQRGITTGSYPLFCQVAPR